MGIHDVWYDDRNAKYVIQLIDSKGTTWFRELSTRDVYFSPRSFKEWLDSLIEEVKLRG